METNSDLLERLLAVGCDRSLAQYLLRNHCAVEITAAMNSLDPQAVGTRLSNLLAALDEGDYVQGGLSSCPDRRSPRTNAVQYVHRITPGKAQTPQISSNWFFAVRP